MARRSAIVGESGYERVALDAYMTPVWCLRALLRVVRPDGCVWEPAAGTGNLVEGLRDAGYDVVASDIHDHGPSYGRMDFLAATAPPQPPGGGRVVILTNPPYDHAEAFVRHALHLTKAGRGAVVMLLRNEWDCAAGRKDLFRIPQFAAKVVLTRRPRWSADEVASPRHNFAFFCWSWLHSVPPRILWPDCDDDAPPPECGRLVL